MGENTRTQITTAATIWQGRLAFGMVSIPVRLYRAARRERTSFHQVCRIDEHHSDAGAASPEGADVDQPDLLRFPPNPAQTGGPTDAGPVMRLHNRLVGEQEDAVIDKSRILKGYALERDRYVVLSPVELDALRPRTSTEIEITEFIRLAEIDPVYFDTSYYVVPDTGGERAYALLYTALKESGYVGFGKLAMHGREHTIVTRPGTSGLILHTMFCINEVRAGEEYRTDPRLLSEKELDLARMLIDARAAAFDPEKLKDAFEERLQALLRSRAASAVLVLSNEGQKKRAPVVDIADALRQSLDAARKPAQRDDHVRANKKKRRNNRHAG